MAAFVVPLTRQSPLSPSLAPLATQGTIRISRGPALRAARPSRSNGLSIALIPAILAAWRGRSQSSVRRPRVQRWSIENANDAAAPSYPGTEDPEKLLSFARELCDYFRNSSRARLSIEDTIKLCQDAERMLKKDETLVRIQVPTGSYLNVVGDVHGQLFDFLSIFEANGWPSEENPFLFNGDFVDRGSYSVEIMLILLAFKLAMPEHFFLSRGNHEERRLNNYYGFTGEVLAKYDLELPVFEAFQGVFRCLPLAHVVNDDVFVTHGGLPRMADEASLDQIASLDRMKEWLDTDEPTQEEIMINDLLWADPHDGNGITWSQRGGSAKMFGCDITEQFLKRNGLSFMIRSHEVKDEGFEWQQNEKCLTVFSAPSYCDSCDNLGAVVRLHADEAEEGERLRPEIRPFDAAEKPEDYVPAMIYAGATHQLWSQANKKAKGEWA